MLSMSKPIKIKVLLRQFSLLMFNLRYIFLFVLLLDRGIAGIREMPHYNYPEGSKGAERENKKKQQQQQQQQKTRRYGSFLSGMLFTLYESFTWQIFTSLGLFTWLVYIRTYCVPIAILMLNFTVTLLSNFFKVRKWCSDVEIVRTEKLSGLADSFAAQTFILVKVLKTKVKRRTK